MRKITLFLFLVLAVTAGILCADKAERNDGKRQDYYDAERIKVEKIQQLTTDGGYGKAKWSPDNKMIAVDWDNSETREEGILFLEFHDSANRVERVALLKNAIIDNFNWAPDSRNIVYTNMEDTSLWIAAIGNNEIEDKKFVLSGKLFPRSPVWSPDGKYIVFLVDKGIGIIKPDGTGFEIVIGRQPGEVIDNIKFISDNEFIYAKGGEIEMEVSPKYGENHTPEYPMFITPLYKYDIKAREVKKIGNDAVNEYVYTNPYSKERHTQKYRKIYYDLSEGDKFIIDRNGTNKVKIWHEFQNLVQTPDGSQWDYMRFGNFSPDASNFVALQGYKSGDSPWGDRLFIMNTDGKSNKKFLTDKAGNYIKASYPMWSPNGKWIIYNVNGNVYVLELSI